MNARLRLAEPRDAAPVAAIYGPIVRDTAISFEVDAPDAAEMERRIATTLETLPWLMAEDARGVVGYAYAASHRARAAYRWSVDVSVYVAESARGCGLGRALYRPLLDWLGAQGFHRAYAGITLPNAASVALHESHGFAFVGRYREVGWKCGAWHDVGWWERDLASPRPSPEEPQPFARWRASDAGVRAIAALAAAG